ncbi:hypothetical protein QTP88_012663 [Uroleucon formosanum]
MATEWYVTPTSRLYFIIFVCLSRSRTVTPINVGKVDRSLKGKKDKVYDTGGGPLHTSMSNKRNISNSSISSKVAYKKSKKFVTPYRFAAVCSDDSSDNIFNKSTNNATARNEKLGLA